MEIDNIEVDDIEIPLRKMRQAAEKAVNEVLIEFTKELSSVHHVKIKHDGAMVSVSQKPEVWRGYDVRIHWPFTVDWIYNEPPISR